MDPRNAATVTTPDLLKAFNEGRGVDPDSINDPDSKLRFYVLFKIKDSDVVCKRDFALTELQQMLAVVAFFFTAAGSAVVISIYEDAPDGWDDFEEYLPISAG